MFRHVPLFGSIMASGLEDRAIVSVGGSGRPLYAIPRSKKVRGDPNPSPNCSSKSRGMPKPPPKARVALSEREQRIRDAIIAGNKKRAQENLEREENLAEKSEIREQNKEKQEEQQGKDECCVCLDKNSETVFIPCRHRCVCASCAVSLRHCPLCRCAIVEKK